MHLNNPSPPNRFVLLCHARTGSTLCGTLLAIHPSIYWAGERFKRTWRRYKVSHIEKWVKPLSRYYLDYQAWRCSKPVYGCKLAPGYVRNITQTIPDLARHGWLIVHLQRRDRFSGAISLAVAQQTGIFNRAGKDSANESISQIRISPEKFLSILSYWINLEQRERQALIDVPHLQVYYEDDLADPTTWNAAAERIFSALGLEPVPVHSRVKKLWNQPYSRIITNYQELVDAVLHSDYADCLAGDLKNI